MEQKTIKSIWFWWILTTIIYILLYLISSVGFGPTGDVAGMIGGFVGLFVPFGILSLITFFNPLGWLSMAIFIVLMVFIDRNLNKLDLSLGFRILINLLFLLVLTTIVDFVRCSPFASWEIFFSGGAKLWVANSLKGFSI